MISKMTMMIVAIIMSNIMTMVMSKAMMMSKTMMMSKVMMMSKTKRCNPGAESRICSQAGSCLPNQMPRLSQLFSEHD